RLPWVRPQRVPNPEGVAEGLRCSGFGRNPFRVAIFFCRLPRVAADGNPGLDDATPSGLKLRTQSSALSTQHSALRTQDSELRTQHSGLNHSALSRSWSQPASKGHAHSHNFFGSFQHTVAPRGLQKTGSGHYPQPLTALLLNENYVPLTRIQPASAQDNVSFQQPLLRP